MTFSSSCTTKWDVWPCSINFHGRNLSSIQSTCPLSLSTVSRPGYTFLLPRSETPNPLPWAHDRPCWLAVMACNACEDLLWKAIECLTWPSSGQGLPLSCCLTARNGVNYSTERVPSLFTLPISREWKLPQARLPRL